MTPTSSERLLTTHDGQPASRSNLRWPPEFRLFLGSHKQPLHVHVAWQHQRLHPTAEAAAYWQPQGTLHQQDFQGSRSKADDIKISI